MTNSLAQQLQQIIFTHHHPADVIPNNAYRNLLGECIAKYEISHTQHKHHPQHERQYGGGPLRCFTINPEFYRRQHRPYRQPHYCGH